MKKFILILVTILAIFLVFISSHIFLSDQVYLAIPIIILICIISLCIISIYDSKLTGRKKIFHTIGNIIIIIISLQLTGVAVVSWNGFLDYRDNATEVFLPNIILYYEENRSNTNTQTPSTDFSYQKIILNKKGYLKAYRTEKSFRGQLDPTIMKQFIASLETNKIFDQECKLNKQASTNLNFEYKISYKSHIITINDTNNNCKDRLEPARNIIYRYLEKVNS